MENSNKTQNKLKLSTYSPRVRHLTSLSVRNLSYKCADVTSYFTLHKDFKSVEFYKSEQLSGSVNFSWNAFNLTYLPSYYTSSSQVCIRVWVTEATSDPKVHLEYEIDLKLLHILEPSTHLIPENGEMYDHMTLTMFNTQFVMPNSHSLTKKEFLYLDTNQPLKISYSSNLLARLQTLLRALKQTERSIERVREDITKHLTDIQSVTEKKEQVELHKLRLENVHHRHDYRKQVFLQKKSKLYSKRAESEKKEKELEAVQKALQQDDYHYSDIKSDFYNSREKLLKEKALLSKRHRQMVYELSLIYPINQTVNGRYTIAGVCLPDPEIVNSQTELACSTALGHCCHLVIMLSRFLEFPLEYPLEYRGSRSLVYDNLRPQPPSQKDRSYPLYSRGKDKKLFLHATFLLNRNIENLRYSQDLHTKDPKLTLRNLKDLFETKFGVGSSPQKVNEPLSPPLPIRRVDSVPSLLRRKSLPALEQHRSLVNWSGLNSPRSANVSSDESVDGNLLTSASNGKGSADEVSANSNREGNSLANSVTLNSHTNETLESRDEVDYKTHLENTAKTLS